MIPDPRLLAALNALARQAMADAPGLAVLGLCGAQGSGKSTLICALRRLPRGDAQRFLAQS